MIGYTQQELERLGAAFTAEEICQQPDTWLKTLAILEQRAEEAQAFLARHIVPGVRLVLTGAGTSAYVGDVARLPLSRSLPCRVESIPTTELVATPALWLEPEVPTVLVSFARSGNSPESVGAFDVMQNGTQSIVHLVITCAAEGKLAQRARQTKGSFLLLLPEETNDRGFAMTSSFSCMLLATLLFFDTNSTQLRRATVEALAAQGRRVLEQDWPRVKALADSKPERVVYLGTGCLAELGKELSLKNMELSNGRIVSIRESVLGFRHGPKTIVNDHTLVVLLNAADSHTRRYVHDLARELHADPGSHWVAAITYTEDPELEQSCDAFICIGGAAMPEHYASLNYALYGQLLGLFNSLALGNTPDTPNPAGVVNRVVKGVTVYPYSGAEEGKS